MKKWYEKIKERRLELGMSQDELAKKAGYSGRSAISHIESGNRDVPVDMLTSLAKALGVEPISLMDDREDAGYYTNAEVAEMAQEVYENPDLKMLFSASRNLSKEDLQLVVDMVKRLKGADE